MSTFSSADNRKRLSSLENKYNKDLVSTAQSGLDLSQVEEKALCKVSTVSFVLMLLSFSCV